MENVLYLNVIVYSAVCLTLLMVFGLGYWLGRKRINRETMLGIVVGAIIGMVSIAGVLLWLA